MINLIKYLSIISFIFIFSACQKSLNFSELINKKSVQKETCNTNQQYDNLKKEQEDYLNHYLNLAGISFSQKNYKQSNIHFDDAIKMYRSFENKGTISASRTLSYITASFLNDTYLDYEGDGYEKVMMHNYKAINYLMLNNKEAARVEIRNSYKKQMEEKQRFSNEIAEYKEENIKQTEKEKTLPRKKKRYRRSKESIYDKLKPLFLGVNSEHMPYQNPFAYYVSALVYEENEEFDDAYIDIKKASNFYPNSKILQEKLLYYAKKAYGKNSNEYNQLIAKSHLKDNLSDTRAEIFINFSSSPKKEEMKVPIYLGDSMQFTSFPTFKLSEYQVTKAIVKNERGETLASSAILTDVDAIVINLFKERVPGIILRQVINVGSKTIASESISNKVDNGNVLVSAAIGLGMSLVNAVTSKADTRSWHTLPSKIHALSFNYDKAQVYTLHLLNKNGIQIEKRPLLLEKNKNLKNSYSIVTIRNNQICQ